MSSYCKIPRFRSVFFKFSLVLSISALCVWPTVGTAASDGRFDIQNTREFRGSPININNVNSLTKKWEYATTPDNGPPVQLITGLTPSDQYGGISMTPAVRGKYVYINDFSGNITKLNRFNGNVIWKKSYINDLSIPGFTVNNSRNTPYLSGNLVIVGSNFGLPDPLCKVIGAPYPRPGLCHLGSGAVVLALNSKTGNVVWRKKVDTNPATKITGSISGFGNLLIVPVAHWEEDFARAYPDISTDPIVPGSTYKCCSARGSIVALDRNTGTMLWKTYLSSGDGSKVRVIGDEIDNPSQANVIGLTDSLKALLADRGFYGVSSYGHHPTIDAARGLVFVATSQNEIAPAVAENCEKARRATGNPDAEIPLPAGLTCANLNQKLNNYGNSMLALDLKNGAVRWQFLARKYDAWHHGCGAPTFGGWTQITPFVFPVPVANAANCDQDPVGPDLGFGVQPMLLKKVAMSAELGGGYRDLVVAGNKDGRVFAVNPDSYGNAQLIWETNVDPGGLYGGLQFGIASDRTRVFFGTENSRNTGRDATKPYVPETEFLDVNGFTALGVRVGPFVKKDGATPIAYAAPGDINLPFPGPNLIYGPVGYPDVYPDPDGTGFPVPGFLKGPVSGPAELWTLVNPPSDVVIDNLNSFQVGSEIKTTVGMVHALSAGSGKILWQRPALDGFTQPVIDSAGAVGTVTVGNNLVFVPYLKNGTLVALDAKTGEKRFEFNHTNSSGERIGGLDGGPAIAGCWIYFGIGSETGAYFANKFFQFKAAGNRLYALKLPTCTMNGYDVTYNLKYDSTFDAVYDEQINDVHETEDDN